MILYAATALFCVSVLTLVVSPVIGIPLVFVAKPFIDATFDQAVLLDFRLTELTAALVPLVIAGHLLFSDEEGRLSRMPLKGIWMLYAADVCFFSGLIAYNQGLREGAEVLLRHLNGLVGFYMLQRFFQSDARVKGLLLGLAAAGLFPVAVGLYQLATGTVWRFEQSEGVIRNIGLWHDAVSLRVYALQTIFAVLVYGAMYAKRTNVPGVLLTWIYTGLTTAVLLKTYSKSGIFTLATWTACWTLLRRQYVALALVAAVGGVFAFWYGDGLIADIFQIYQKELGFLSGAVEKTRTFAGRWYGWQEMLAEWERFHWAAKLFGSGKVAIGAHNDYLQILFHGGALGLVIYVWLLLAIGARILGDLRRATDPLSVGALMLFTMWLVDAVGLVPSAYPGYQWFVWGMVGLSFARRTQERPASTDAKAEADPDATAAPSRYEPLVPVGARSGRRFPLLSP
ncbi:MAG: hypothetical protein AB1555_13865 [Nitrospirota bacterium]